MSNRKIHFVNYELYTPCGLNACEKELDSTIDLNDVTCKRCLDSLASTKGFRFVKSESKWISVKDRLPEEGVPVLIVYDCCGEPDIDVMKRYHGQTIYESGEVFDYPNHFRGPRGFLTDDVTHWMPLPEPPDEV
jgi:hypothetical protein